MDRPEHLSVTNKRTSSSRATTIAFVGAFHIAAIFAIVAGLTPTIFPKAPPGPIDVIKLKPDEPTKPQAPPVDWLKPEGLPANPPPIPTSKDNGGPRGTTPTQAGDNTGPKIEPLRGITTTHTTPPYPITSIRLGEQGIVRLQLIVSADGRVISATVERSSGSSVLDQAAVDWVRAHWRYQPRTVDGQAQTATTEADIRFDLRNAR
jgi:protein TonB